MLIGKNEPVPMTPSRSELSGSRAARIIVATSVAFLGAAVATPALSADAGPDLSGFWLRVGNLAFDAILDDDEGKPIARLQPKRPDAEEIWAGDSDNPILQPWAREIVKKNAELRDAPATRLHRRQFLLALRRSASREPARRG